MTCPMYEDYTRGCVTTFMELLKFGTFDLCESDEYKECPFYRIIKGVGHVCEFAKEYCPIYLYLPSQDFEGVLQMTKNYCLSENKVNCERYKVRKAGKESPKDLHPDGSKIIVEV